MCGIAGMVGLEYDREIQHEMLKTMYHRGPDGQGIYESDGCALLHSRLAVIDLAGGAQPMELTWGEENYVMVYNGELYNTQHIRSLLTHLGHSFRTHSDTEVVLHAYVQWGQEALSMLNGIFAFAVWENNGRRLFLVRDRMGVKPLFYMLHQNGILFASEMKTILRYPSVEARLDGEGAAQLLLLGPGRIPGSGVFSGMKELEPGCCGCFCGGKWEVRRYWKLLDREHRENFSQTVEHVRWLVNDAISRQMVSDVPIGTFLSGGLDSSIITSVCSRESETPLLTFSLDYKDNDRNFRSGKFQPESDNQYINLMRRHLTTDHRWTVLTPEDLTGHMAEATCARDLPGMADVDFSLLAFCKQIRTHVKVALSGECADEIFGGYPWYRDPEVRAAEGFPWAQNTERRASFLQPEVLNGIDPREFVLSHYRDTVMQSDILPGTEAQERRMKEMVNLNQRWFMQTLLDRKDRMSMACGLEVRVPFCDYRIAEYLYGVPWEKKDFRGVEKGLLRCAVDGLLPKEVLWRKKSPYPKTHDPRYTDLVAGLLRKLLQNPNAPIFSLVRKEALETLVYDDPAWPWYGQLMKKPQTIAYMLQLNLWMEMYRVRLV